jgi:RimJ/RimL family protein N-acetyltransferase
MAQRTYSAHLADGLYDLRALPGTWANQDIMFSDSPVHSDEQLAIIGARSVAAFIRDKNWSQDRVSYFSCTENFSFLSACRVADTNKGFWGRYYWALSPQTGELLGDILAYHPPSDQLLPGAQDAVTIGYYLFEAQRGKGWSAKLVSGFTEMLHESGLARVCAETEPLNIRSSKALLRANYSYVGYGEPSVVAPATAPGLIMQRFMKVAGSKSRNWPYQPRPGGFYLS